MADKIDQVTRLRSDMAYAPDRPDFASAVGGYNRAEVNKFLDEQNASWESMRRVFYERTNELRDELSLLGEENRRLRTAMDEIAPIAAVSTRDPETGAQDTRKLVEQVAGILKARHEAELASRDDRIAVLTRSLDAMRAELSKLTALIGGREAQIDGLNRMLAEKADMLAHADEKSSAALAKIRMQLDEMSRAHSAALQEKDAQIEELSLANGPVLKEKEMEIERLKGQNTAKDAEIESLGKEIGNRDERIASYNRVLAGSDARAAELNAALQSKTDEAATLSDAVEKKNAAIAAFDVELTNMRNDVRDARTAVDRSKERIESLESELALRRAAPSTEELAGKVGEVAELREKLAVSEHEAQRNGEEITRLSSVLSEKENELSKLRGAINDIMKIKKQLDGEEDDRTDPNLKAVREKETCKIIAPNFSTGATR